jgi:hypothetical protein
MEPIDAPAGAQMEDGSTLTPLAGDRALFVGALSPALWSGQDHRWITLTSPPSPLRGHVAIRLGDGNVLVAGGDGDAVSRGDRSAIALALAAGLGVLLLLAGTIVAVRAIRPPLGVLVLAVFLASVAAVAIDAVLSVPRGGG